MINVLFIIIQTKMGGAERLVHNLALKLDRKVFNPSLAYFYKGDELKEFQNLGISIYHIPKVKRFDISTMRNIACVIKDNNIDIVNAHHFMPLVYSSYGCKIANRIKLVYTQHSEWELKHLKWMWVKVGHFLLSSADMSVGVSEKVTRSIQNKFGLDGSKAATIWNGVSILGPERLGDKRELKETLNIDPDCKVIGMVANFRLVKNHIFLLKAYNELLKDYQNVKLILIGQSFDGDPTNSGSEIRTYITENGLGQHVSILGYRSDVPNLLGVMDIFCLTSIKEGLPISLIEAMAAGLPVIGSKVEGIEDVIIHGRNGFLVDQDDVHGLKDCLYSLLQDEAVCKRLGESSRHMAREKYSLEQCVNRYQELFSSMMR